MCTFRRKGTNPFLPCTCVLGNAIPAGAGAQVERLPQLQVQEPHLQEGVDIACGAEVRQAHKRVLGDRERAKKGELPWSPVLP